MHNDIEQDDQGVGRSFWSGTIAFGLVSVPVSLYVANRRSRVSLRMLDEDGTPLSRRYFCSKEDIPLERDDLVRGYEIERDQFVEVEDEELEALVPEKSREIDLRRFVPLDDIDPMYFERAYFLVPEEGASKAYRLLAASMVDMGRAGIATFVMRGKEYLIAIIAEGGVLRAETLRFHDELRSPQDVGLPELETASARDTQALLKAIKGLQAEDINKSELSDHQSEKLLNLVERKLEEGDDVIAAPEAPEAEPESAEVIDLMQVLKRSLEEKKTTEPASEDERAQSPTRAKRDKRESAGNKGSRKSGGKPASEVSNVDPNTSKTELYEMAKSLHIPGRSQMSKDELLQAVQRR